MEFVPGTELAEELTLQKSGNLFNSDQPLGASAALWDGENVCLPADGTVGQEKLELCLLGAARPRVQVTTGEGKGNGPVPPCSLCPAVFQGGDGKENVPDWESG